jgi:hypothetical protein
MFRAAEPHETSKISSYPEFTLITNGGLLNLNWSAYFESTTCVVVFIRQIELGQ